MAPETWALMLVVTFLLGYIIGHRLGTTEGYKQGAVFSPIELRRRALERGRCVICGTPVRGFVREGETAGSRDDRGTAGPTCEGYHEEGYGVGPCDRDA